MPCRCCQCPRASMASVTAGGPNLASQVAGACLVHCYYLLMLTVPRQVLHHHRHHHHCHHRHHRHHHHRHVPLSSFTSIPAIPHLVCRAQIHVDPQLGGHQGQQCCRKFLSGFHTQPDASVSTVTWRLMGGFCLSFGWKKYEEMERCEVLWHSSMLFFVRLTGS